VRRRAPPTQSRAVARRTGAAGARRPAGCPPRVLDAGLRVLDLATARESRRARGAPPERRRCDGAGTRRASTVRRATGARRAAAVRGAAAARRIVRVSRCAHGTGAALTIPLRERERRRRMMSTAPRGRRGAADHRRAGRVMSTQPWCRSPGAPASSRPSPDPRPPTPDPRPTRARRGRAAPPGPACRSRAAGSRRRRAPRRAAPAGRAAPSRPVAPRRRPAPW